MDATALDGIRVIDFTRVLSGPYCTLQLAELGADVIKVEHPKGGDSTRSFTVSNVEGQSTYFMQINHSKRSVVLDLSSEEGRKNAFELARSADVVVENFRPGVMKRLGLDYESLSAGSESLLYASISGYGSSGEFARRPGYDPVIQAESGLMAMTGEPDGQPMRTGMSLVDAVTGMFTAQSILAALVQRGRTGRGQHVEVSLFGSGVNMLVNFAGAYLMTGESPGRPGNGNLVAQPSNLYQAADGPLVLTCVGDDAFRRLCEDVLDAPEMASDSKFATNGQRLANGAELDQRLEELLGKAPRAHWIERLHAAGIPAGEVRDVAQALSSEEFHSLDLISRVQHPVAGETPVLRAPMKLHGAARATARPAPLLGEHTEEILAELREPEG